jgi:hypothetical protein
MNIDIYTTTSETICQGLQGLRGLQTAAEMAEDRGEIVVVADGVEVSAQAGDTAEDIEARIYAAQRADEALDELDTEEDEARLEADLDEAQAAQDEELERLMWDGQDDAEEVARMLSPGQAWEQYVGDQSVAEWVANEGPTDTDGLEEYLAQTWPKDTDETARPIVARKLADYLNAPTTEPVTGSGWYELTNGLVRRIDWRDGRMVEGAIVAGWDGVA